MTALFVLNGAKVVALIYAFSRLDYSAAHKSDGSASSCGVDEFRCRTGNCISSVLLCDGRPDCEDSSDEEQNECSKTELLCPDYAFRCSYGACVDKDVTCNGVKDCLDNSDEELPKCPGMGSPDSSDSYDCSDSQFKCNNGQCTDKSSLCDGIVDCNDGSDETSTTCGSFACPQLVFRCNYGACIDRDKKCDQKRDCVDGSDEDPALCGSPAATSPSVPMTTERISTTKQRLPQSLRCTGPQHPQNGRWKIHGSLCPRNVDCVFPLSVELEPGTRLIYSCNAGYRLRGSADVFCTSQGKWSSKPICTEITCVPLRSASITIVSCTYLGNRTNCGKPVLPGTSAKVSCAEGYQKDLSEVGRKERVICSQNGRWDPRPIRCIPVSLTINVHVEGNAVRVQSKASPEQTPTTLVEVLDDRVITYTGQRTSGKNSPVDVFLNIPQDTVK